MHARTINNKRARDVMADDVAMRYILHVTLAIIITFQGDMA